MMTDQTPIAGTEVTGGPPSPEKYRYYAPHDTLHIFLSPGEEADSAEPAPGVILRATESGSFVGVTVLNYSKWDRAALAALVPVKIDWPKVARGRY